jgi:hypothetical protein
LVCPELQCNVRRALEDERSSSRGSTREAGTLVSIYEHEHEYKAVNYDGLTSVLIEAVKELKAQNEALRSRIEALERTQQ